jgi:hypothetical protein
LDECIVTAYENDRPRDILNEPHQTFYTNSNQATYILTGKARVASPYLMEKVTAYILLKVYILLLFIQPNCPDI